MTAVHSRWFITINTNKTDIDKNDLKKVYEDFYHHIEDFIIYRHPNHELIESKNEASVEIGDKYGRVHIHSLLEISHNSNIQLNLDKIRTFFAEQLGLSSIHLDVRYIRDETFSIRKYIAKLKEQNAKT